MGKTHAQDANYCIQVSVFDDVIVCRLEAELEEARLQHEAELEAELSRQEAAAAERMATELERNQREAEQQLSQQRDEYETRLADLEKTLVRC